jgi:hypothetical protein
MVSSTATAINEAEGVEDSHASNDSMPHVAAVTLWNSLSLQMLIVVVAPMTGGVVSTMLGVNEQVPVLPLESVAEQVTPTALPRSKKKGEAGVHVTTGGVSQSHASSTTAAENAISACL